MDGKDMRSRAILIGSTVLFVFVTIAASQIQNKQKPSSQFLGSAESNSKQLIQQGRQIFRFDTFGNEAFWGNQLQLHQAVNNLSP